MASWNDYDFGPCHFVFSLKSTWLDVHIAPITFCVLLVLHLHGTTFPFWLASHQCPFRCVSCKPRRVLGEPCGSQPSGMEIHGHSQWAGQFNVNAPLYIWNLTTIPGEKATPAATVLTCPSPGEAHVLPTAILLEFSTGVLVSTSLLSTGRQTSQGDTGRTGSNPWLLMFQCSFSKGWHHHHV